VLLIGLGAVLVADLLLDWRLGPDLDGFGIAAQHSQSTGLAGWGAAAGALLVAFLVLEIRRTRNREMEHATGRS